MAPAEGAAYRPAGMTASRLELNLVRLLCRCEAMAAEKRDPEEWRLEKTSSAEKALANQFLTPGRVPTTARERVPATKTVHLQSRARYTSEMRSELLGDSPSACSTGAGREEAHGGGGAPAGGRAGPGAAAAAGPAGAAVGGDAGPGPEPQVQHTGRTGRHQEGQPDAVALHQDGRPEPGEAEGGVGAAGAARAEVGELAALGHAHRRLLHLHQHDPLHPGHAQAQIGPAGPAHRALCTCHCQPRPSPMAPPNAPPLPPRSHTLGGRRVPPPD
ncbi:vesicle transport protein USE1 isoform X2 [Oryctolagus cuniculus]|uniref:vesicle transport protein USE1 isoform X2 n=1 Tax=Oryctolagus cuniculus TaxID=9986 RepID=UPI003879C632